MPCDQWCSVRFGQARHYKPQWKSRCLPTETCRVLAHVTATDATWVQGRLESRKPCLRAVNSTSRVYEWLAGASQPSVMLIGTPHTRRARHAPVTKELPRTTVGPMAGQGGYCRSVLPRLHLANVFALLCGGRGRAFESHRGRQVAWPAAKSRTVGIPRSPGSQPTSSLIWT